VAPTPAQQRRARVAPYLAAPGGAVLAVSLAIGLSGLVVAVDGGIDGRGLAAVPLTMAASAAITAFVAYPLGMPAIAAVESLLRRTAGRADRLRYPVYALAGTAPAALLSMTSAAEPERVLPIALLGSGAAVVAALTLQLARRRPVLGARLAVGVPVALLVAVLAIEAAT